MHVNIRYKHIYAVLDRYTSESCKKKAEGLLLAVITAVVGFFSLPWAARGNKLTALFMDIGKESHDLKARDKILNIFCYQI